MEAATTEAEAMEETAVGRARYGGEVAGSEVTTVETVEATWGEAVRGLAAVELAVGLAAELVVTKEERRAAWMAVEMAVG